jgi:hypothetical protein
MEDQPTLAGLHEELVGVIDRLVLCKTLVEISALIGKYSSRVWSAHEAKVTKCESLTSEEIDAAAQRVNGILSKGGGKDEISHFMKKLFQDKGLEKDAPA